MGATVVTGAVVGAAVVGGAVVGAAVGFGLRVVGGLARRVVGGAVTGATLTVVVDSSVVEDEVDATVVEGSWVTRSVVAPLTSSTVLAVLVSEVAGGLVVEVVAGISAVMLCGSSAPDSFETPKMTPLRTTRTSNQPIHRHPLDALSLSNTA